MPAQTPQRLPSSTSLTLALAFTLLTTLTTATSPTKNNTIISIPPNYLHLLPPDYTYALNATFASGTSTSSPSLNALLASAASAPFISYSSEFSALLGDDPEVKLVAYRPGVSFAHEAGVWLPSDHEGGGDGGKVYFSTGGDQAPARVEVLDLASGDISPLEGEVKILNPNGGCWFDGLVYFTAFENNETYRGGLFSYAPGTGEVEAVVNSYFGLPFNGLDDVVGVTLPGVKGGRRGKGKGMGEVQKYLFITDLSFVSGHTSYTNIPKPVLPNAVWRFDLVNQILLPVISRTDIPSPNGVRVSPDNRTLYVTDTGDTLNNDTAKTALGGLSSSPAIYKYEISSTGFPVNRQLFGYARQGSADGIHVDDEGRVWTGESEGIVVRSPHGQVLGLFNSQFFLKGNTPGSPPLANFAIAGNVVVVLGTEQIWTVKLAKTPVAADSGIVD